jgi:hypothetical protein
MGWHEPQYEQIRDAEKNTSCALLWGVVGGWPEEYEVGALGLWAWDPAGHDWQRTRDSIYQWLYGPSAAQTARTFDDQLSALKDLFQLPPWRFSPNKGWPCRLKKVEDRAQSLALIRDLEGLLAELRDKARAETAIDPARLESVYLEPMQATLVYAHKMALLDYPEHTVPDFKQTMTRLIDAGKLNEAEQLLRETRLRLRPQLDRIRQTLTGLKGVDQYVAFWDEQLVGMDQWQQRVARQREERKRWFQKLLRGEVANLFPYKEQVPEDQLEKLLARLADPPPAGRLLAELGADDWLGEPARTVGAFCAGEYTSNGRAMVAIAYPRRVPSRPSDAAEVRATLTVPSFAGRVVLDAFVNDTRLENRYPGHRYMQLWAGDRLVWEEDIAPTRDGKEWTSLDVTELAKPNTTLKLRFRVIDKRPVGDHLTVTFLGPVRLRTAPAK